MNSYRARVRVGTDTMLVDLDANSLAQARALAASLYGSSNVLFVTPA